MLWAITSLVPSTIAVWGINQTHLIANIYQQWQRLSSPQDLITQYIDAIAISVDAWLQNHPLLAWLIHHPLISVGLLAIVLLLLWSLFQAFVEITQELWVQLLKVPLQFGRWMIRGVYRAVIASIAMAGINTPFPTRLPINNSASVDVIHTIPIGTGETLADADIVRLLHRLEQLAQEQNHILRKIALLAETKYQTPTP